jgi:hypothetical protein
MFYSEHASRESAKGFMHLVYSWMAFALTVTAGIAYFVAQSPAIHNYIFSNPGLPILLLIVQLGLVIVLSAMINKLSYTAAVTLFVVYAASLGISLSTIFLVYTNESIYAAFAVSAGTFGVMALYGYVTDTDLTSVGSYAFMGLIGLIIASLVNMYFQNAMAEYVISIVGVLLFTALTAYDSQKIKQLAYAPISDEQTRGKLALMGALTLYLDFINLFLFILRLMGDRRK